MGIYRAILVSIICCWAMAGSAQSLEQNLDKYWQYRHKLVAQYMLVGDGQGYSLPASYINPGLERMKWSDNTIWLGWYIGTLATEYHLLHNPRYQNYHNGDTDRIQENLTELYFALKALTRLDETAETSFTWNASCGVPNARNGFFIRDDVPADFTDSFPGYNFVDADFVEQNYANEMSQDQAYHVLLGLSLVKRFVPDTVVVNGMNLHNEAVEQAALIGAWVHQDAWLIKNPACGNKNVDRGHDATLLAKGLNLALVYISDGDQNYEADINSTSELVWNSLTNPALFVNVDNLHMTMALAAVGEGWGAPTLDNLMVLADTNKWYAYPMLYVALRDTATASNYATHKPTINLWADSMLNEAPIDGPLSTYPNQNGHGYGVNNRFIRPRINHYAGINPNEEGHQWNGLDYMLLHNLRLIVDPNIWPEVDDTTGVGSINGTSVNIYPNPTQGSVFVDWATGNPAQLRVLDVHGKEVLLQQLTSPRAIDLGGLPQGVYILKLADGKAINHTHRLVLLGDGQ